MKQILFDDLYLWSVFNETRQLDFNGHLWVRPEGNVLVDPVVMIPSDLEQLERLGGAAWIVLTNTDHERQTEFFRQRTGARVAAHELDAAQLLIPVDRRLADGEEVVPGLRVIHLRHGKSPGEVALYWPQKKLVLAGDLVVGAPVGRISLLMDEKLQDPSRAALELRRLLALDFAHLLVGDGHAILHQGRERLLECLEERRDIYINKINVDEVAWVPTAATGRVSSTGRPAHYQWDDKNLDVLVGARQLGYRLLRLPPGRATFPLHFHHFGEEVFYLLEGGCTLVSDRGEFAVRQGDIIAFPAGARGAHKFKNEGNTACVLLAVGNELPHDLGEYPDSQKVLTKALPGWGIFRKQDAVTYWEGEQ
ncbi:MAG: cupin domain-containing protein [Candidatus Latescibacteria bacterium]|nr:cupin domain-containing protein [Candidatus Latescibacterota bacterium]